MRFSWLQGAWLVLPRPGGILILSAVLVAPAGTRRGLLELGKASSFNEEYRPRDKVRHVLEGILAGGLRAAIKAIRGKRDEAARLAPALPA